MIDEADTGLTAHPMIFISYARADRPRVKPLADALSAQGYDVWWDALIEGGSGFAEMIEAKLAAADAVIVVWSAASVGSDWVRDEAAHARDRKRIVPVSLDGAEAPLGFRQYHIIDLSKWRGRADAPEIVKVIAGISSLGASSLGAVKPNASNAAPTGFSRRSVLIASGGTVAIVAGGLVAINPFGGGRSANSIAVLPFANMSAEKEQVYFSDGLSEEIRSALSRNPALKVAAPTSANTFRDRVADAKVIGAKLGVAYLLEGSVRRAGEVVRIAAQLSDTKSGFSKWSQSFDRQLTDVFAVQSEIAAIVAEALAVRVSSSAAAVGGTTNVLAYDPFLRGRALFNSDGGEDADRAALAQFEAAIAADPKYAAAHAARSRSILAIANQYAQASDLRRLYDDGLDNAKRAVALAPDLAAAQLALGQAYSSAKLDVKSASVPFERAATLGKGDADIQILYAVFSARAGRKQQAIDAAARAMDLDRLNPLTFRAAGLVQYFARDFEAAIPLSRQALTLNPKLRNANGNIGNCKLMLGRFVEAQEAFHAEPAALLRLPGLAIAARKLNESAAASAAMAQLKAELGDSALYQQAQILAQWGNADGAIETLRKAKVIGDSGLLQAAVDPLLTPLKSDVRFKALIAV